MYMLIQKTKFAEGAYAVINKNHEKVLFLFEEEDDAERYAMMLEEESTEKRIVKVVEVDSEMAIKTCISNGLNYSIITPNDFVIPPVN